MQSFLPADDSLQTFLTDLIRDKYGKDTDPSVIDEYKKDLLPRLDQWILLKTMTEVAMHSQEDLQKLQKMTEENKPANEVQAFLHTIITDPPSFLSKTLLSFRQTYLGAP